MSSPRSYKRSSSPKKERSPKRSRSSSPKKSKSPKKEKSPKKSQSPRRTRSPRPQSPYSKWQNEEIKRLDQSHARAAKATGTSNTAPCSPGQIRRVAYERNTRSGKLISVPSACVPSRTGGRPRSPVRIGPLERGTLRKHGYSVNESDAARHRALERAVEEYGPTTVERKLLAVSTLQKNTNPTYSATMRRDAEYVADMRM